MVTNTPRDILSGRKDEPASLCYRFEYQRLKFRREIIYTHVAKAVLAPKFCVNSNNARKRKRSLKQVLHI